MRPEFADPATLIADAFADFLPPAQITVADWAAQHRWLDNSGGGHVGLWDNAIAPYLVEPMQALTDPAYTAMALVGPGQCGKTAIADNWMLQSIDTDPASFLRFMQTEDAVNAYVKNNINPLIESHERIKARLGPRPIDDSLSFKRFRGMTVQFLAAARSNLISKSAPRIVVDEQDAYDPGLGDVKNLIDVRRQTFGRDSMACLISHPDRAAGADPVHWQAGIMAVYADSTRSTWWWRCPHCDAVSSPNPGTARFMALEYPADAPLDVVAADARLVCPTSGCLIEDGARRAMNASGRWIAAGQTIDEDGRIEGAPVPRDIAGYWIVGAMSPFLLSGIGGLAAARVKAARALAAGEGDQSLREVMTKQWGIPYDPPRRVGSLDAQALADRAEPGLALGIVPDGVRFLTAAADVQGTRFEGLVRGWGPGGESWIVDHWSIPADPAASPDDWDTMLARLLTPLPLADASGRVLAIHAAAFDSGGQDGVTLQAYGAWQRAKKAGQVRRRGKVDGRDAWSLLPTKGLSGGNAGRLAVVYPDSARRDRFAAARGQIPLAVYNPNLFKDDLAVQLGVADHGPWAVHIPAALRGNHLAAAPRETEPPHRFFEQLVAETRTAKNTWIKPAPSTRNEALDLMVLTHVAAHLHGLPRIRWDQPRAWHAAWDQNSGVSRTTPASPTIASPNHAPTETLLPMATPPAPAVARPTVVVHDLSPVRRGPFSRLA